MKDIVNQNHLANELSPYLKQHATNPVDWYPWCDSALEKARLEDKPILLSIGYASCHWCHVMAHESFEDPETAALMNKYFINIKVDREERPDLDKIYQTTHYLLTQRDGGWPLTVFLMPDDLTPFYSGTFFPLKSRYQLPAFTEVLSVIIDMFQNHRDELNRQNLELKKILHHESKVNEEVKITTLPLITANEILQWNYDSVNGGFSGAPKFFQPTKLTYLLLDKSPLVEQTLNLIALGGINDQVGGGFFRYAIDDEWHIPHFEKMLYDNAQLISLYAEASHIYKEPNFLNIAKETGDWVIDTMQSPEGGYYASIDADSDGEEGKYYVWKKSELKLLLTPEEYAVAKPYFGLDESANFDHHWHLYAALSLDEIANQLNLAKHVVKDLIKQIKSKLLERRQSRKMPTIDNEILTSWNALMVKGMLSLGQISTDKKYLDSGERALKFLLKKVWKDKRLFACYKNGKSYVSGYLDDYAFLLDASLTAAAIFPQSVYGNVAIDIADTLLNYFYDDEHGGFYFTARDHEPLLYRPKTYVDEATPAGNGIVAQNFLKLYQITQDKKYLDPVIKTFKSVWPNLSQYSSEHCSLLIALKEYLQPFTS